MLSCLSVTLVDCDDAHWNSLKIIPTDDYRRELPLGRPNIMNIYIYCSVDKKLSYCWETVRCESMPGIAEMDMEMTT